MAFSLSQNTKAAIDVVLGLVGGLLGYLAANATQFGAQAPYVSIIGVVGGYAVSDVLSFVQTGQAPSAQEVETQVQSAWRMSKPLIQAEITKLSPTDQIIANGALQQIEGLIAKSNNAQS